MSRVRPYYADAALSAAFYDVVTAADGSLAGDVGLYAALAPAGGRILELGAGSGRVAHALAERGFQVVGIELAPAMLAQAEARLSSLPAEVAGRMEFRRGDMAAIDLKQTFDAVICPFFTLAHTPAGAAWRNTFATAARHLGAGGLAAFHLPRLEVMRRLPPVDPARPVFDHALPDGGRLRLFVKARTYREPPGRLEQVIEYVVLDTQGRPVQRSAERLTYWMADPEPLAAAAGLAPDRPPEDLGGAGDLWVFRKS